MSMNIKQIYKMTLSAASATPLIMMLVSSAVQAAPVKNEVDSLLEARMLAESGWTYPAIEDELKTRREAAARAEAEDAKVRAEQQRKQNQGQNAAREN